jgi:hypothetical protein
MLSKLKENIEIRKKVSENDAIILTDIFIDYFNRSF